MRFAASLVCLSLLVPASTVRAQIPVVQKAAHSGSPAQAITQLIELTPPDGGPNGWFGQSVAIGGDTIAISSSSNDVGQGKIYVYVKPSTGWQDATLTAELTISGFSGVLGAPVAISPDGNTIVVNGSLDGNTAFPSVFVYVKPDGGWVNMTQTAALWATNEVFDFGFSIATDGDNILVGGLGCSGNGDFSSGQAYLFVKPAGGWTDMPQTGYLEEADPLSCDDYGSSVAIQGDTAVVGRTGDGVTPPVDYGSLYVFTKPAGGWTTMKQTAKLSANPNYFYDILGGAVSLSGNTILATARHKEAPNTVAYIFAEPAGGWVNGTETATLTDTNKGVASIGVGSALYGPAAAVIANTGGRFTGIKALTLYDEPAGGWQNASTPNAGIIPSDETATDNFGLRAVAIQGDIIVVGALGATRDGNSAEGAAYIFQLK